MKKHNSNNINSIIPDKLKTFKIMIYRIFFTNCKRLSILLALLIVAINTLLAQDTITVRGKILDDLNQPVANVTVGVEGSLEFPVATNEAGEFTVKVLSGNVWLNITTSSDYHKKRVYLNNRTMLTIYLSGIDMDSGDENVKVLSQNFLRRDLVPAFSTLNSEKILYTPTLSVDQFMQGRVAGINVINRSGEPGSGAAAFIRGVNSINSSSQPMYIVDGLPIASFDVFQSTIDGYEYNPLLSINPLDISNITIIKDPLITSAYGSKASNGLVFIETLDPSVTQTVIELDLRTGYSLAPDGRIPQLDAGQHKTLISELLISSGMQEEQIIENYPNLFLTPEDQRYIDYQHNTDWQDLVFTNAFFNTINVKVKGGDEIARYGLSFGYNNYGGIIKNTNYDGYSLRFVSLLNIFTWLKTNVGVALNYSNANLKESGIVEQTSPILTSLGKSPMLNPYQYDVEGQELAILALVDELGVSNPLAVTNSCDAKNNNFNFTSSIGIQATINQNLNLFSNFGLNRIVLKEKLFMPNIGMDLYYNKEAINVSEATNNSLSTFYNNTYVNYSKKINNNNFISSSTGVNLLNNKFQYDMALTKNAHENDQYRMLQDGTFNLRETGGTNRTWNWLSFYENINYNYKNKYLVMASLSLDGSSRVGDNASNTLKIGGVPFGIFYSAGVGWRISNEAFLKNKSKLEELKIRLSYGLSGNDNIGETNAAKYYSGTKYRETSALFPALVPNDKLTYETVSQLNAGVDLALWGNRFKTSFDVYKSQTDNLLIYAPLIAFLGYEFRPENNGKMQNKGLDLSLFYRPINRANFKWDVEGWYSTSTNEILEIKGEKLVTQIQGAEIVNMVGEKANSFYGYIFEGVYATNDEARDAGLINNKSIPFIGGDAKFSDLSGPEGVPDNKIDDYDKTVIGSSMPKHYGGFSNTFTYKRWSLNAFFQFTMGNELFNYVRYQNENMVGLENQSKKVLSRWQYDGQVTTVPRAVYGDPIGNSSFSSRWIEDGSYLRLKNVVLSYTIPDEFLVFKNARFYISASNLVTFTKYIGYDPEFAYSRSHMYQGIDYGLAPQTRQFIFGVKLGL